jgi:long-chain fatty acid transport protein
VARALLLVSLLCPLAARAHPLLAPRPVPDAIAGPADPHVAALFYNPGALGPLRGVNLFLDGGLRIPTGTIARDPVEGRPGGTATISAADFDAFVGATWDLRTNRITLGVAVYAPYVELSSFGNDSAVRYQEIKQRYVLLNETVAAAFKVTDRFSFGAAFNMTESWIDYRFARDVAAASGSPAVDAPNGPCGASPCGLENPLAAERLRLNGFGWGPGFSIGVLGRPTDRLWLALSYISHVFDTGSQPLRGDRGTRVYPAPGTACSDPAADDPRTCNGGLVLKLAVPDVIYAGARVTVTRRIELDAVLRWVHYGAQSQLDVSTQGDTLPQLAVAGRGYALPPQFLLDRGLQDAWMVGLGGRFAVGDKLRLAPSIYFETSAVEAGAVSAAAIDAPKLDLALTAEWRPVRHLIVGAHVGVTAYVLDRVDSRFSARAEARCVDARFSLDACAASDAGDGLPSASGRYTYVVPHLGLAVGMNY